MNSELERLLEIARGTKQNLNRETIQEYDELKSSLNEKLSQHQYISDVFIELEITPPYDLWLSNSKIWKKKAEKYDVLMTHTKYHNIFGCQYHFDVKALNRKIQFMQSEKHEQEQQIIKLQEELRKKE